MILTHGANSLKRKDGISLIILEYFNKHYGEERTGNIQSENVTYDLTCPLQIPGGAPVWSNNQPNDLIYNSNKVKQVCYSNKFTIEFFGKVTQLGSYDDNTSPTCGFRIDADNYWHAVVTPSTWYSGDVDFWINDSRQIGARNMNSRDWNHYEICADGSLAYFFVNGILIKQVTINPINTYFCIFGKYLTRDAISLAQVALWDGPKHTANFSVNYNPIHYTL